MEFSEVLIKEHASIRRALNVLQEMMRNAELDPSINIHDVNALLIFLHYFADIYHQGKEESILFPILRRSQRFIRGDFAREELAGLLAEHSEERWLIEKAQLALFSKEPSEFIENARTLAQVLSEHALKEEQELFPMAEETLTQPEAEEVSRRFAEADASLGDSRRTLLMELLQDLEGKYLRRVA
jgi:hemerythrin-like domain-containing protein